MKKKKTKSSFDKFLDFLEAASVVILVYKMFKEIILREIMKLGFTTRPSLFGKKLLSNPLFFTPKEHIHWLAAQPMEELHIRSFDGYDLVGHYFHAENAKRLVICAHGWRGSYKGDFGMIGRYLHDRECDLLLIEQRAQHASEGEFMSLGILEAKDVLDWANLMTQKTDLPIYLYGVSMGATAVEMAAGKKRLPAQVKGVIADCGYNSPYDIVAKAAKGMGTFFSAFVSTVNRRCQTDVGCSLKDDSAVESLEHTKVPVFFIHGREDSFVPLDMGLQNYEACASRKKMIVVDGAEHCQSFVLDADHIIQEMWSFFEWDECAGEN